MAKETREPQQASANEHRVTRVRNRVPRSCLPCRTRKLKCNREKPCQNCIVRGKEASASCSYVGVANPKASGAVNAKSGTVDVKGRIDRLENLVRAMISGDNSADSTSTIVSRSPDDVFDDLPSRVKPVSPSSSGETASPRSQIDSSGIPGGLNASTDSRSTHWDVILNDICAIKDAWIEKDDLEVVAGETSDSSGNAYRPSFLSGLSPPPDRETLLSSLPSREAADKLLLRFIDTYNPAAPARCSIHIPTFYKQYQRHWEDPSKTRLIWIGLLFGVLTFAMHSYRTPGQEPIEYEGMSTTLFNLYRIRTAQCLQSANITRPTEFMLETMLIYSMAEYLDQRDGEMGVWILSGTIMHLALQQGYHRDPSTYPNISPFQMEMRRRLWILVSNHELLFSVQIGVPRTIRYAECDVLPPRNLHESELSEEMTEIPTARPMTEPTEISYQITKSRVMIAYGMVIEHLNTLTSHPYNEVMRLDANLIEAKDLIPQHLAWVPIVEMIGLTEGQIMERSIIQLFLNKAICVLHRKYLTSPDTKYSYSRKACVSSALFLLKQQAILHAECHPGGRLPRVKWWAFSLQNHDYLLAAMIICLSLYHDKRQENSTQLLAVGSEKSKQRTEQLAALVRARDIWSEIANVCGDAKKAIRILSVVMEKLGMASSSQLDDLSTPDSMQGNGQVDEDRQPGIATEASRTATTTPAHQNSLEVSWNSAISDPMDIAAPPYQNMDIITDNLFSSNGMFSSWEPNLDLPESLDWSSWDLYVNRNNQTSSMENQMWPEVTSSFELPMDIAYEQETTWPMA